LSGGDGQSLMGNNAYQGGGYKADSSTAVIELQSGTYSGNQVAGSIGGGGSLVVSGASASLYGFGTIHLNLDVKAGSLSWSNSATLDKLTLEGGSFGGTGTL